MCIITWECIDRNTIITKCCNNSVDPEMEQSLRNSVLFKSHLSLLKSVAMCGCTDTHTHVHRMHADV